MVLQRGTKYKQKCTESRHFLQSHLIPSRCRQPLFHHVQLSSYDLNLCRRKRFKIVVFQVRVNCVNNVVYAEGFPRQ